MVGNKVRMDVVLLIRVSSPCCAVDLLIWVVDYVYVSLVVHKVRLDLLEVYLLFQIHSDVWVVPANLSHIDDLLGNYLRVNVKIKHLHVTSN